MAKIGINDRTEEPHKLDALTFVILDNKPHLNEKGIDYLSRWVGRLIIVTTNPNHPVFLAKDKYDNVEVLKYDELNLKQMLEDLCEKYDAKRLTIQSGGNMNGRFLREDLVDYASVVVAPVLVGGRDTPTLIDGDAISLPSELSAIRPMELLECKVLDNSYIHLRYKVMHKNA